MVGGTSGIGYGIACLVAAEAKSATVIIGGRTKPENIPHANIEFRKLDASLMSSIKAYTDAYKAAQEPKLDLLVVSQGLFTMAGRTETAEGIDRKMALHYYGRQLLVRELLPCLKDDAKVIFVLDALRGSPSKLNWEDLDLKHTFSLVNAANHCISMTDAMIQQYAAEQVQSGTKRHFVHAYPGFVKTSLGRDMPWFLRLITGPLASLMAVSADTSAQNLVQGTYDESAASDKNDGKLFSYIDGKGKPIANKVEWTAEQRTKVMEHTWKVIDAALAGSS